MPCGLSSLFSLFQALDTFNAAIVSPVYYVMFTTLTIVASVIMFKVNYLIHLLVSFFIWDDFPLLGS